MIASRSSSTAMGGLFHRRPCSASTFRLWHDWIVLRLSELLRVSATLDGDGRSRLADAAAAAWRVPAGAARFWRSSASHVFVIPTEIPAATHYLRFVPHDAPEAAKLERAARVMEAWGKRGLAVVQPVASAAGRLTERVRTEDGDLVAMVVPAAAGQELSIKDLTPERASEWGSAMAALHGAPAGPGLGHDDSQLCLHDSPPWRADDPAFSDAAAAVYREMERWPVGGDQIGMIHGDFELDNLRFGTASPIAFDADEARWDWFAADIASAVRDLIDPRTADVTEPALFEAFLAGYRRSRSFGTEEESRLPLHAAAFVARSVVELDGVIDAGSAPADPTWLSDLRAALQRHQERSRSLVLTQAERLRQGASGTA